MNLRKQYICFIQHICRKYTHTAVSILASYGCYNIDLGLPVKNNRNAMLHISGEYISKIKVCRDRRTAVGWVAPSAGIKEGSLTDLSPSF